MQCCNVSRLQNNPRNNLEQKYTVVYKCVYLLLHVSFTYCSLFAFFITIAMKCLRHYTVYLYTKYQRQAGTSNNNDPLNLNGMRSFSRYVKHKINRLKTLSNAGDECNTWFANF